MSPMKSTEKLPCLACGAWASYYRYDTAKRRWPDQTDWRATYCRTCRSMPGRNGKNMVNDDGQIMWLRRIGKHPNVRKCTQCGDPVYYRIKADKGLCPDCDGRRATRIEIRQCQFPDCPYGAEGQPAWMVLGAPGKRKGGKYCTNECARRDNKRRSEARRTHRRRDPNARRWTGKKDKRLRVAYLHSYRCGECRKLIDVSKPAGHPQALEIDHIIPVKDGGTDNIGNLRPLHRQCHQQRQDEAQLGLDIT